MGWFTQMYIYAKGWLTHEWARLALTVLVMLVVMATYIVAATVITNPLLYMGHAVTMVLAVWQLTTWATDLYMKATKGTTYAEMAAESRDRIAFHRGRLDAYTEMHDHLLPRSDNN